MMRIPRAGAGPRRPRAQRERAREPLRGVGGLVARDPRSDGERAHGLESHGLRVDRFLERAELLARGDEDALHGVELRLHGHGAVADFIPCARRIVRVVRSWREGRERRAVSDREFFRIVKF